VTYSWTWRCDYW